MATKKKSTGRPRKKSPPKSAHKAPKKTGKNKLGVKNSLVNNINAKKKTGASKPRKKSTVSKKAYDDMQDNWGRKSK